MQTGHDYGLTQLFKFRSTYLPAIAARFEVQNPGIRFTDGEVYSMQELCGFETLVRGSSPWCDVFSHEDWLNFEYARDVLHYYRAGPGNKYGPAMGWLWLNATAGLMRRAPDAGRLFFSLYGPLFVIPVWELRVALTSENSVHDGDIIPMLAALDLSPSEQHLPVTHRPQERAWRTSQVVPMNGRTIFELHSCNSSRPRPNANNKKSQEHFVRININDGIVSLPTCTSGPGSSCPLEDFLALVRRRGVEIGDFREICGLGENASGRITFLHQ